MSTVSILFLIGRILYGGFFIKSSWGHFSHHKDLAAYAASKGTPMAGLSVYIAGLLILFGGLGIILGFYIQLSVAAIALFLIVVTGYMHRYWKEQDPMARSANQTNFYKNLALLGAVLMFLVVPIPWQLALF